MDKDKIVKGTINKLKLDMLHKELLEEKSPKESIKTIEEFLIDQKIRGNREKIQEVLADLKLKGFFNTLFEIQGMEPEWQKFKKEVGLSGFVFRI